MVWCGFQTPTRKTIINYEKHQKYIKPKTPGVFYNVFYVKCFLGFGGLPIGWAVDSNLNSMFFCNDRWKIFGCYWDDGLLFSSGFVTKLPCFLLMVFKHVFFALLKVMLLKIRLLVFVFCDLLGYYFACFSGNFKVQGCFAAMFLALWFFCGACFKMHMVVSTDWMASLIFSLNSVLLVGVGA